MGKKKHQQHHASSTNAGSHFAIEWGTHKRVDEQCGTLCCTEKPTIEDADSGLWFCQNCSDAWWEQQERSASCVCPGSGVLHPVMRDPFTLVFSFLQSPLHLRGSCRFLLECFEHALYMEVPLACALLGGKNAKKSWLSADSLAFLQAGNFGTFSLEKQKRVRSFPHPMISNETSHFPDEFLAGSKNIESFILSKISSITFIGQGFLSEAKSLEVIDLSSLPEVDIQTERFLKGCSSLRRVSITDIPQQCTLGPYFMADCGCTLESLRLDLPQLTVFEDFAFTNTSFRGDLILSGFHQLVDIKDYFFARRSTDDDDDGVHHQEGPHHSSSEGKAVGAAAEGVFHSLTLMDLPKLRTIGAHFMEAALITEVHLEGLDSLKKIGAGFCARCRSLQYFEMKDLKELEELGHQFLAECPNLIEVKLFRLPKLQKIGNYFGYASKNLRTVSFESLDSLDSIASSFLESCSSIKYFELRDLPSLVQVCDAFLARCDALCCIVFKNLPQLRRIDFSPSRSIDALRVIFFIDCSVLGEPSYRGMSQIMLRQVEFLCLRSDNVSTSWLDQDLKDREHDFEIFEQAHGRRCETISRGGGTKVKEQSWISSFSIDEYVPVRRQVTLKTSSELAGFTINYPLSRKQQNSTLGQMALHGEEASIWGALKTVVGVSDDETLLKIVNSSNNDKN